MTVRIGITGPIGCGKSTVVGWLRERGAVVVDADAIARAVLAPGTPETRVVFDTFGDAVRAEDGTLDRAALAAIVFADPESLASLEAIVHPAVRLHVRAAIAEAAAADRPAVLIEAIKLVEGGLADACDEVWLVTCKPDVQRARMAARGSSPSDVERRLASQGPIRERLRPRATRIIDTSGDASESRRLVEDAYRLAIDAAAGRAG